MRQLFISKLVYKKSDEYHVGKPLKEYPNWRGRLIGMLGLCLLIVSIWSTIEFINTYTRDRAILQRSEQELRACGQCPTATLDKDLRDFSSERLANDETRFWMTIFPFLISLASLYIGWSVRNQQLYVCSEGLLYTDGRHTDAIRWDETQELTLDQIHPHALCLYRGSGRPFNTSHSHFHFTSKELWNTIEDALLPYLLPLALERLKNGETLTFITSAPGVIELNMQGIRYEGRVGKWREIEGARAGGGYIAFKLDGNWEKQMAQVANAQLCATLIRALKENSTITN